MQASLLVDSANRDTWHEGNSKVSGPDAEASSWLLVGGLRFGIGAGIEGKVSVPYAWMSAKDPAGDANQSGVGDLLTELRWSRGVAGWSYGLSAGTYWPLGDLNSDGLPVTATFSTGTIDPTFGAHIAGPPVGSFGWSIASSTRRMISDQDNGRRLGSSITSSLMVDRPLGSNLNGQLQLIHFHRGTDSGMVMEPSGGDWVYLAPAISYKFFAERASALQATLGVRIPVVQDVEGRQLVESPSVNLGVGYSLGF